MNLTISSAAVADRPRDAKLNVYASCNASVIIMLRIFTLMTNVMKLPACIRSRSVGSVYSEGARI